MISQSTEVPAMAKPFNPNADELFYLEISNVRAPGSHRVKGLNNSHDFVWNKDWGHPRLVKDYRGGKGESNVMFTFADYSEAMNDILAGCQRWQLKYALRMGTAGIAQKVKNGPNKRRYPIIRGNAKDRLNPINLPLPERIKALEAQLEILKDQAKNEKKDEHQSQGSGTAEGISIEVAQSLGKEEGKPGGDVQENVSGQSAGGGEGGQDQSQEEAPLGQDSHSDGAVGGLSPDIVLDSIHEENMEHIQATLKADDVDDSDVHISDIRPVHQPSDVEMAQIHKNRALPAEVLANLTPNGAKELAKARGMKGVFNSKPETLVKAHLKWQGENIK